MIDARSSLVLCTLALAGTAPLLADEPVRLTEKYTPASQYHVSTRVTLEGSLNLPPEKDKQASPRTLSVKGDSSIEYDERVLALASDEQVRKTIRIYQQIDFRRKVGELEQNGTVRPTVHRMVLLRKNNLKAPFSPDGPLLWQEMDLIRTDVFTPALGGLLPDSTVKVNDHWTARAAAIQELTDMGRIDDGRIDCRLVEIVLTPEKHQRARIAFTGTVRGLNEDGPNRQQLDGFLYFDLDEEQITYLSLDGTSFMLDKDGKEQGRVKGQFVLARQVMHNIRALTDEALRNVPTEPRDDLTRILFEDTDLGLRFVYPRRWRLVSAEGRRIDLDAADGNGMRLTLEPSRNLPTGAQFLAESQRWLQEQKALVTRTDPPRRLQSAPQELETFSLSAEVKRQQVELDYYVARQNGGGVTISARLLPGKQLSDVRKEVEGIARSISILKEIKQTEKRVER